MWPTRRCTWCFEGTPIRCTPLQTHTVSPPRLNPPTSFWTTPWPTSTVTQSWVVDLDTGERTENYGEGTGLPRELWGGDRAPQGTMGRGQGSPGNYGEGTGLPRELWGGDRELGRGRELHAGKSRDRELDTGERGRGGQGTGTRTGSGAGNCETVGTARERWKGMQCFGIVWDFLDFNIHNYYQFKYRV